VISPFGLLYRFNVTAAPLFPRLVSRGSRFTGSQIAREERKRIAVEGEWRVLRNYGVDFRENDKGEQSAPVHADHPQSDLSSFFAFAPA
jgi:hypothetical protein